MITILIFKALADLGFYFTPAFLAVAIFHVSYRWVFAGLVLMTAGYALSYPLADRGAAKYLPLAPACLMMLSIVPGIVFTESAGFSGVVSGFSGVVSGFSGAVSGFSGAVAGFFSTIAGFSSVIAGQETVSVWFLLILLPPFLYTLKNVRNGQYTMVREREIDHFKLYLPMAVILLIGEFLVEAYGALRSYSIPMALTVFSSQIMLMRALRHDKEIYCQPKYQALNLVILTAIGCGTRFLSSSLFLSSALSIAAWLFRVLIRPVLSLFFFLLEWVIYLFFRLVSFFIRDFGDEFPIIANAEGVCDSMNEFFDTQQADTSYLGLLRAVLILCAAVVVCMLLYRLFKYLSDQSGVSLKTERQTTERVSLDPAPKMGGIRRGARTPVEQVREQYRHYLALLRADGVKLQGSDTSLDVLRKTAGETSAEDSVSADKSRQTGRRSKEWTESGLRNQEKQLRELYLRARYDGEASPEDAREARALVKELKKAR